MNEMKTIVLRCIESNYIPQYLLSTPKIWVLNSTNFRLMLIRRFAPMNEMKTILLRCIVSNYLPQC